MYYLLRLFLIDLRLHIFPGLQMLNYYLRPVVHSFIKRARLLFLEVREDTGTDCLMVWRRQSEGNRASYTVYGNA